MSIMINRIINIIRYKNQYEVYYIIYSVNRLLSKSYLN